MLDAQIASSSLDLSNTRVIQPLATETVQTTKTSFSEQLQERRRIQKQISSRRSQLQQQNMAVRQKIADANQHFYANKLESPLLNHEQADTHLTLGTSDVVLTQQVSLSMRQSLPSASSDNKTFSVNHITVANVENVQAQSTASSIDRWLSRQSISSSALSAAEKIPETVDADKNLYAAQPELLNKKADHVVLSEKIQIPFKSPEWHQSFNEHIVWMVHQRLTAAEIQLNPPELGPLSARLKVLENKKVQLTFFSHHPLVRAALEEGLPQLSQMLTEQGLSLDQADVQDQNARSNDSVPMAFVADRIHSTESSELSRPRLLYGLVDYYA